jgi:hypothetical protein
MMNQVPQEESATIVGKKGHFVKDCWVKGGSKEGQAPS